MSSDHWLERELVEAFDADLVEERGLEPDELVVRLLDELGVTSPAIRGEMLRNVDRARAVLIHARDSFGIRNRAAFAIATWRVKADPRPTSYGAELAELEEQAPTLEALEHVWSLEASPWRESLLAMMAVAIERNGGARALLEGAGMRPLDPQAELPLEH